MKNANIHSNTNDYNNDNDKYLRQNKVVVLPSSIRSKHLKKKVKFLLSFNIHTFFQILQNIFLIYDSNKTCLINFPFFYGFWRGFYLVSKVE